MRIGIAVFSGTGNTAFVSGLLAEELQGFGASVDLLPIEASAVGSVRNGTAPFNPANYDLFGIGHPVLGFGPTPLVSCFVNALRPGSGSVFIFKSAADSHPINNSASEDLIRMLERKGYEVVHDFLYVMPCNWIVSYRRSLNLQIVDTAREKARGHARDLVAGRASRLRIHRHWRVIARFMHTLESRYGRKQFGRALHATELCTFCGQCAEGCPVGNIAQNGGRITFGDNCLFCMRCVYRCPRRAITARGMAWCIIKGGYRLDDYLNAPDVDRPFITSRSRGYWKHFREYFGVR